MGKTHLRFSYGACSKPSSEYYYWDRKNRKEISCYCDISINTEYNKRCPVIFHAKQENNEKDVNYLKEEIIAKNHSPPSLFKLSLYAVNHITLEHFLPIKVLTQLHNKNNSINDIYLKLNPDYILDLKQTRKRWYE